MTRTEAAQFARDLWPLFKTMGREQWRDHARNVARNKGKDEAWLSVALPWLEAHFEHAKTNGQ
jgi:hypothetical protein